MEKQGWLFELLKREGIMEGSKQSRKEYCWQYYKSQLLLYIEAMQEAKYDSEYDPRRNEHITGKDGRFKKKKCIDQAKKPFDSPVPLLCLRHTICILQEMEEGRVRYQDIRARNKRQECCNDKKLASQVFNPRKMYVKHAMAVWLNKRPQKKNDGPAKQVVMTRNILFVKNISNTIRNYV